MSTVTVPLSACASVHYLARLLALSHQQTYTCEPQGQMSITTLTTLTHALGMKDTQFALSRAWVALAQTAELVTSVSGALRSTPAAVQWVALPPLLQLERLRQTWWRIPATTWAGIAYQWPRATTTRWESLLLTLCQWLVHIEADWIELNAVRHYLDTQGLLKPTGPAARLPKAVAGVAAQHWAVARFILLWWLPALGLARVRRTGKHWAVALTDEGRTWLLGALRQRALWNAPPTDAAVELTAPDSYIVWPTADFPSLTITDYPERHAIHCHYTISAPAALTYHLSHIAEPVAISPLQPDLHYWEAKYKLTPDSMARAAEWGYTPEQIILLLGQFSSGELPQAVLSRLRDWQTTITTLTAQAGYYLNIQPLLLKALHARKAFSKRVYLVGGTQWQRRFTPQGAWVSQTEAPALFRYLRRRGYTLQVQDNTAPAPPTALSHAGLPLPALLLICQTYQALRQRLPDLARADVAQVIRNLECALAAQDRAAVAQMLESQNAILARALNPILDVGTTELFHTRIERAITTCTPLLITYVDTHAQRTQREVYPLRLETHGDHTYLVARCDLRGEERHFRLDRIVAVEDAVEDVVKDDVS